MLLKFTVTLAFAPINLTLNNRHIRLKLMYVNKINNIYTDKLLNNISAFKRINVKYSDI